MANDFDFTKETRAISFKVQICKKRLEEEGLTVKPFMKAKSCIRNNS
eukprot:CAMPEP_0168341556 /NCGR_PEP_ID=MMETSP0213-20121227/14773_1 /TAXON_ID=151035 /ORGANISM="Euplotes harpa, Strain FSP1.4" /LENGTH=46 /DNA_ID= /DNA_START= /DNA_END= /DNA_ORIENTATION=